MTATAAARLTSVPPALGGFTQAEKMGALVRMRMVAGRTRDFVTAAPKAAWGWLSKDSFIAGAARWTGGKVGTAAAFLGTGAIVGAGMLALSTGTGRSTVSALFRPVRWAGRLLVRTYTGIAGLIGRLGRPGRWVRSQMLAGRDMVVGSQTRTGLVRATRNYYDANIAHHARTSGPLMYLARTVGMFLVAPKAVALLMMIPWAPAAIILSSLARGLFVGAIFWHIWCTLLLTADAGMKWVGFSEGVGEEMRPRPFTETANVVKSTVVEEAAEAPGDVGVSENPGQGSDPVADALHDPAAVGGNRAAKRAVKAAAVPAAG